MNAITEHVERFLDKDEVGRRLGVSGWTVRQWSQDGRFIPATMVGNLPRWREQDVNLWIAARAAQQSDIEATASAPRRKRG